MNNKEQTPINNRQTTNNTQRTTINKQQSTNNETGRQTADDRQS